MICDSYAAIDQRMYRLGPIADLSVPLNLEGAQPNAYGVPPASSRPYSGEGFTLDTRDGGSCNCSTITITPHCNGTHTECVGHLTKARFTLGDIIVPVRMPATLISVMPGKNEITAAKIERHEFSGSFATALIVRTLPNAKSKKTRQWTSDRTPYFSVAAMTAIRTRGVQHLLVDLPSLDPMQDEGRLAAHRVFWDMPPGSTDLPNGSAQHRTVTEMIFVPDDVPDGRYLLMLTYPDWRTDAAPSRPLLFFLEETA